ncbi:hypothetical protein AUEXF2481DRAFT_674136 [Aureobasidium subglaciale EXF-2481]|uniref:Uncharacterized protein n=1 Tax=Aureobasidium subglaciale (strain EXF-2481) TaxID=1043005 RepID=A0A074ZC06_AURSE|nr:uncharacterized protein AUEXF2481DRAFT_674136 [Aureobasidium subglaciale EXF-2481]KEQ96266.1 hypothetical protein AUEXF2481DRAFT_674136 [Aureobasidium subglaciale EXF-2481]
MTATRKGPGHFRSLPDNKSPIYFRFSLPALLPAWAGSTSSAANYPTTVSTYALRQTQLSGHTFLSCHLVAHDTALPIASLFLNSDAVCYRELQQLSKSVEPAIQLGYLCHCSSMPGSTNFPSAIRDPSSSEPTPKLNTPVSARQPTNLVSECRRQRPFFPTATIASPQVPCN